MKIAVCVSGHLRTVRHCVESQKHFFRNADFFLHSWDDIDDDLVARYGAKNYVSEKYDLDDSDYKKSLVRQYHYPYLWLSRQWEGVRRCYNLIADPFQYDLIARVRYDLIFAGVFNPGMFDLQPGYVLLPAENNFLGGYNDTFAISLPSDMKTYCSMPVAESACWRIEKYHPELVLKHWLDLNSITGMKVLKNNKIMRESHVALPFDQIPQWDRNAAEYRRQALQQEIDEIRCVLASS